MLSISHVIFGTVGKVGNDNPAEFVAILKAHKTVRDAFMSEADDQDFTFFVPADINNRVAAFLAQTTPHHAEFALKFVQAHTSDVEYPLSAFKADPKVSEVKMLNGVARKIEVVAGTPEVISVGGVPLSVPNNRARNAIWHTIKTVRILGCQFLTLSMVSINLSFDSVLVDACRSSRTRSTSLWTRYFSNMASSRCTRRTRAITC
jgi:hypothetical protein